MCLRSVEQFSVAATAEMGAAKARENSKLCSKRNLCNAAKELPWVCLLVGLYALLFVLRRRGVLTTGTTAIPAAIGTLLVLVIRTLILLRVGIISYSESRQTTIHRLMGSATGRAGGALPPP